MVCSPEIGTSWITQPFSWKEDNSVIGDGRTGAGGRHYARGESGGDIAARAERQGAALRRARIDLDEMDVTSLVANEIHAV